MHAGREEMQKILVYRNKILDLPEIIWAQIILFRLNLIFKRSRRWAGPTNLPSMRLRARRFLPLLTRASSTAFTISPWSPQKSNKPMGIDKKSLIVYMNAFTSLPRDALQEIWATASKPRFLLSERDFKWLSAATDHNENMYFRRLFTWHIRQTYWIAALS